MANNNNYKRGYSGYKSKRRYYKKRKFYGKQYNKSQSKRMDKPTTWTTRIPSQVFPDRMNLKPRWTRTYQIAAGATPLYTFPIPLNGWSSTAPTYLPDYINNMDGIYSFYRVHGSQIKIEMLGTQVAPSQTSAIEVVIFPISSGTSIDPTLTIDTARSLPYAKSWIIPSQLTTRVPKLKNFITVRKLDGISKAQAEDNDYQGFMNVGTITVPSRLCRWYVAVGIPGGGNYPAFTYRATVTYYASVYGRDNIDGV